MSGQSVTISVEVINTGSAEGVYTARLKVNGVVEKTEQDTVAAGDTRILEFAVIAGKTGSYQVEIGGSKAEYRVLSQPLSIGWPWPTGIIAVSILAALSLLFVLVGLSLLFFVRQGRI
jgi:hypothetical protein